MKVSVLGWHEDQLGLVDAAPPQAGKAVIRGLASDEEPFAE